MKKTLFVHLFIIIGISQFGCKKNETITGKQHNTNKAFIESSLVPLDFCSITNNEPELHFGLDRSAGNNRYVFTQTDVNMGLSNFHANFKYSDSGIVQNLDSSKQSLRINELMQLYSVLESEPNFHYDRDSDYSALRLHFALEGKKIIIIYEPIVLKSTIVQNECSIVTTDKYYRIDSNNNLVVIDNYSFSLLVSNFQSISSKIHIIHPINPSMHKFINTNDATGDIRSNIVSFQQIAKMYCDNSQGATASDRINFTIVANQNESLTSNYRMHVVANFGLGTSSPSSGTYKSYAADYMEMCPTKCNIVSINYYY